MRIYVGIPVHGGVSGHTVGSLLFLQQAALSAGHTVDFDIEVGGSIITKARNRIARRFLENGCDVLVFIDADMEFAAKDILTLVESRARVAALQYVARQDGGRWNSQPEYGPDGEPEAYQIDGNVWLKVKAVGTGLMTIKRDALEMMAEAYSSQCYDDNGPTVALFDFALQDGRYIGEDYLFCQRYRNLGGDIWTLVDATTGHVGEKVYRGNYCEYLGGVKGPT